MVIVHASIDLFVHSSWEMKMHHLFVLGINAYNLFCRVSFLDRLLFLFPLLKTEISSIFLVLKDYIPRQSIFYKINNALFYLTFLKFRVLDFYTDILHNNTYIETVVQKYSVENWGMTLVLSGSLYGLYALNLYWFFIMNKVLYKIFCQSINTDKLCHYVCKHMHWLNIPLCVWVYSHAPHDRNLFDVIGVTCLSISSYLYHHDIYERLHTGKIQEYSIPTQENVVLFWNDVLMIHLRSFLTVVTKYYSHPYSLHMIAFSGSVHLFFLYVSVLTLFELFLPRTGPSQQYFYFINNVNQMVPVAVDVILICLESRKEEAVPFLWINVAMGIVLMVEPFYKCNHALFHLLLIPHNALICLSNIRQPRFSNTF